jgi:ABC-type transport system involved in multi-copper enzyme maturation permease subunit
MLSAREVGIVAQRELTRNLRSTKGIAMFVLFFLGGLLPAMLRFFLRRATGDVSDAESHARFQAVLQYEYGSDAIAKHMADAPALLYFLFTGTLTFLPLLVLLVGFDQIVGEVQHRTLRYSAGRASRVSIVAGKALGIWGVAGVMISVLHVTVWVIALIQGGQPAGDVISWGGRMLLFAVICAAAYVGFASLISSLFRTPIVALFVGAGAGFGLWLTYQGFRFLASDTARALFAGTRPDPASPPSPPAGWQKIFDALTWAFPNRYEKLLVVPDALQVLGGLGLFIAWGAACVALASLVVSRRDV